MIRITGGEFRGRGLRVPAGTATRPTQARMRQALFNSIQQRIPGARVLDLFSGSGALAIEALSRGAESAVSVESGRPALAVLERNREELGLGRRLQILSFPVDSSWSRLERSAPFDLVFADPPYAGGWEMKLLEGGAIEKLLAPGGLFVLEWSPLKATVETLPERVGGLMKVREKEYGESMLTHYLFGEPETLSETSDAPVQNDREGEDDA